MSAEEARGLLTWATPGPLSAAADANEAGTIWCVRDDRGVRVALLGGNDGPDSRLLAAAPDLAATVIALSEERDRLRATLYCEGYAPCSSAACNCGGWHK